MAIEMRSPQQRSDKIPITRAAAPGASRTSLSIRRLGVDTGITLSASLSSGMIAV